MARIVQTDLFAAGPQGVGETAPRRVRPAGALPNPLAEAYRRAAEHGPRVLSPQEALSLLLERGGRARDPAAAAAALLARFGDVAHVMGAGGPELSAIVGAEAAADLRLVQDLMLRMLEFEARKRPLLSSYAAVTAYLRAALGGRAREAFHVLFLDKANQLIADERLGEGTIDHAPVYPREVMRRALELAAASCCLVHNHPTGGASPSRADIDMTRQVVEAGRALQIVVHDHFLVADDQVVSFKALGLM